MAEFLTFLLELHPPFSFLGVTLQSEDMSNSSLRFYFFTESFFQFHLWISHRAIKHFKPTDITLHPHRMRVHLMNVFLQQYLQLGKKLHTSVAKHFISCLDRPLEWLSMNSANRYIAMNFLSLGFNYYNLIFQSCTYWSFTWKQHSFFL